LGLALLCGGCATAPPADTACQDLRALNRAARAGTLSEPQRACLSARADDARDPERVTASRLLLWAARSADDDGTAWRRRAEAHLALAPDDVDVLLRLAHLHARSGPSQAARALELTERGLVAAEGDPTISDRVRLDLHKTRTIAAHMLAPPEAPPATRDRMARAARDWLLAARAAGVPTDDPLQACTNAGATEAFCTGRTEVLRGMAP